MTPVIQGDSIKKDKGYEMVNIGGEDKELKNNDIAPPLIQAVKAGNLPELNRLINSSDILVIDSGGATALHWAASYDDMEIGIEMVKILLHRCSINSNTSLESKLINIKDKINQNALFWAAAKGNFEVFKILVERGASLDFDYKNQTVFHILGMCENFESSSRCAEYLSDAKFFDNDIKKLTSYLDSERKGSKRTALMNAAMSGNSELLGILISAGANPSKIDHLNRNIFHFAAGNAIEEDSEECVKILMINNLNENWSVIRKDLLSSFDNSGKCPIHIAARRGFTEVIKMLKDYIHLSEGKTGFTPLHSAAALGNQERSKLCVEAILEIAISGGNLKVILNNQDEVGCTPLYLSAQHKNLESCKLMLLNGPKFDIRSVRGKTCLEKVYEKVPQAISVLLEKAIKNSGYVDHLGSVNTYAQLDFGPILGYSSSKESIYKETEELAKVCYAKFEDRKEILKNTFIKIFIHQKWNKVKWFFFTFRIVHIIWFFLNFLLLVNVFRVNCPYTDAEVFSWTKLRPSASEEKNKAKSLSECKTTPVLYGSGLLNLIALLVYILSQFHQTKQRFHWIYRPVKTFNLEETIWIERWAYKIFHYFNIMFRILPCWAFLIATGIFICTLPAIGILILDETTHYLIAGVAGLFIWLAIYAELGKFPRFRVYINLLMRSTATLLLAIAVTAPILFGFATVFVVLMPGEPSFSSAAQSFVKVITFMIGELDYNDLFYGEGKENIFSGFVMLALAIFIVIIVVLLVNFLIGLAAEEISDFWERAEIWKLCTQLEQIVMLESFLDETITFCGRGFLKRHLMLMPPVIESSKIVEQKRVATIYIPGLPQKLQKELHELNFKTIKQVRYY